MSSYSSFLQQKPTDWSTPLGFPSLAGLPLPVRPGLQLEEELPCIGKQDLPGSKNWFLYVLIWFRGVAGILFIWRKHHFNLIVYQGILYWNRSFLGSQQRCWQIWGTLDGCWTDWDMFYFSAWFTKLGQQPPAKDGRFTSQIWKIVTIRHPWPSWDSNKLQHVWRQKSLD